MTFPQHEDRMCGISAWIWGYESNQVFAESTVPMHMMQSCSRSCTLLLQYNLVTLWINFQHSYWFFQYTIYRNQFQWKCRWNWVEQRKASSDVSSSLITVLRRSVVYKRARQLLLFTAASGFAQGLGHHFCMPALLHTPSVKYLG